VTDDLDPGETVIAGAGALNCPESGTIDATFRRLASRKNLTTKGSPFRVMVIP
jgi:hypothetical protein